MNTGHGMSSGIEGMGNDGALNSADGNAGADRPGREPDAPEAFDAGGVGARWALARVFGRLDAVLDAEHDALQEGRTAELEDLTQRKSQCLLDLTRLSRSLNVEALAAQEGGEAFLRELGRVKARLGENEAMLKRYMEAAREVASLVADGLRASESDGTYAEAGPFGRYGR